MARWEDGMLPEVEQAPEVGSPRQNESNWSNKAEQVGGAPPSPLLRSPGPSSHSRSSLCRFRSTAPAHPRVLVAFFLGTICYQDAVSYYKAHFNASHDNQ